MNRFPASRLVQRTLPALTVLALASSACLAQTPEAAGERATLTELRETTLGLIEALVEQGLLSRTKADELIRKARRGAEANAAAPAAAAPAAAGLAPAAAATWGQPRTVQRVPYLPETARAQLKDEIRNDVLMTAREEGWADARQLPPWIRSVKVSGDMRVRAQADLLDDNNLAPEIFRAQTDSPSWAPDLTNTQHDRQRMSVRARVAFDAKTSDSVTAGVRLSTGSSSGSPTSASQTLGNDFNRFGVSMDRAWMRWEPLANLSVQGGRMEVPFDKTDLLFPDDMSLDGVAAKGELDLASGLFGFAHAGAFPLAEFANTARDKYLLGAQLGLDWAPDGKWLLRGALGGYNFRNVEGQRESELPPTGALSGTTGYQSSQYPSAVRQKGNTLINLNAPASTAAPVWGLASKFRPVNLNLSLTARHFLPYEASLSLDYVVNTGFDRADIQRRAGTNAVADLKAMTQAFQTRLSFGYAHPQEYGEWNTFIAWRKFDRDAWVDAYTDTTWHLGGTNYKGFSLGGQFAIDRRATLGLRLTSTRNLDDGVRYTNAGVTSGNLSSAPLKIDVFQIDANVRF